QTDATLDLYDDSSMFSRQPMGGGGEARGQVLVLEEKLTWLNDEFIDGRINVNIAPREVLLAIPDMTEAIADAILGARPAAGEDSAQAAQVMSMRRSPVWLLTEGLVDVPTFKRLGPWLTTTGDVYSFQVLGHFDQGGPTTRLEAMVDGTKKTAAGNVSAGLNRTGAGVFPGPAGWQGGSVK
ncbi:hypothetical protein E3A20_18720, partial [Planctomyces bekefii]